MKYSTEELKAMVKALDVIGLEATEDNAMHYEDCGYLTINTSNGNSYAWYLDGDGLESCIRVSDLAEVNAKDVGLAD